MRCRACDTVLTDYELTRKSAQSGEFLDLCNGCFKEIKGSVDAIDNPDNLTAFDYIDPDVWPERNMNE
jgi:hypothetical protein